MHIRTVRPHILTLLTWSALLSSGCASNGIDIEQIRTTPVESVVSSADQAMAAGDQEKALTILDAAGKAHPTSPQPWTKKARMYFDAGNYPSAILAAEEALQRDTASDEARSIALVSSLRIAVKYVSDLTAEEGLTGDARPDGEKLAAKLREILNEPVLVPSDKKKQPRRPLSQTPRSSPGSRSLPSAPGPSPSVSPDPFSSLK